jgi:hypothetical protein
MVLGNDTKFVNEAELQLHIQQITALLYTAERKGFSYTSSEIIDINKYKIISRQELIKRILKENHKPFVFLFNKN